MITNTEFTDQQKEYIMCCEMIDTKLIACAGSGKTRCIIFKMDYLIKEKKVKNNELLMLTFSRFTRDDFINKISKYKITTIDNNYIKTIDSFAKNIIDPNNEIDVSLLSYKFMKYLEKTSMSDIKNNIKLSNIKMIFVDESQDLNETQYNILKYMKEKNGTIINMIGDPNQNIYQFRNSSDKFLTDFNAKIFYLTKNFRSYDHIINFSKYLRPVPTLNIDGVLGYYPAKPTIIFHDDDSELEQHLISLLENAKKINIDFSDIAILAPTRGRMRGYGRSNGLCLVSNLLYKNKIKFKQFYEESTDELNTNIKYDPQKGHINILTYMGSKGLEWKFVILIDADICLINKRIFTEDKHKHDQYLLYVACSRAINNVVIFAKYRNTDGNLNFQLNPWFSHVPKEYYIMDKRFIDYFKYPRLKIREHGDNEKKITKILDKISESELNELSELCSGYEKKITKIYEHDFSSSISSNMFLGKYVENLFLAYYRMSNKIEKKKYIDIDNIVNSKHIVTDIPVNVSDWFFMNRQHLSWEQYDKEKNMLDCSIVETVNKKFNREIKLSDHTIVNDGYFKSFILSLNDEIKKNYTKYLTSTDTKKIRKYLFNMMVIIYSLETQHYFHVMSRGQRFKPLLKSCDKLFVQIEKFAYETPKVFTETNISVSKWGLVGEIDLIEQLNNNKIIWELKCSSDIMLKNILHVLMYNLMYFNIETNNDICVNFINFLRGEIINIKINLTLQKINRIKSIFIR